jgi:hypothetical protein
VNLSSLGNGDVQTDKLFQALFPIFSFNSTLVTWFDEDSGYIIEVHNAIDDGGEEAAIEYSARGKTKNGPMYENDYLVRMTIRDGKIYSVRPYFDTHRVHKVLYDLDQDS